MKKILSVLLAAVIALSCASLFAAGAATQQLWIRFGGDDVDSADSDKAVSWWQAENGEYYLSEINPRFGGAYLHAYGAGVDFIKLIEKNLHGEENENQIGDYEEGVVMMMYDSVVIRRSGELAE